MPLISSAVSIHVSRIKLITYLNSGIVIGLDEAVGPGATEGRGGGEEIRQQS
jgi:hypothetical protein